MGTAARAFSERSVRVRARDPNVTRTTRVHRGHDASEHSALGSSSDPPQHDPVGIPPRNRGGDDIEVRTKRIALFIDLENVNLHLERIADTISVERIRLALRDFGELIALFAFTDVTRASFALLRDLDQLGVSVVNCPKRIGTGVPLEDTVDEHLRKHVRMFLDVGVDVIAIATNDNDFVGVIHEAKQRQREVILLVGEPDASPELQRIADHVRFIGSPFLRELSAFVQRMRMPGDAVTPATVTAAIADHVDVAHALAELLVLVDREPLGMPEKLLRDQCWRNPNTALPNIALPEEGSVCIRVLQELGCLVRRAATAGEGRRRNALVVDRAHPFAAFALHMCTPVPAGT